MDELLKFITVDAECIYLWKNVYHRIFKKHMGDKDMQPMM